MPNLLETAFADRVLLAANRSHGVSVTLTSGGLTTDAFTSRRNWKVHTAIGQEYGLEVKTTMRDYRFPVSSVVIDSNTIEPRTGDTITEGSELFKILPPDDNTPSVELLAGGLEWLVHTKRVE